MLDKDMKSSGDVLRTDFIRACLYTDENDMSKEEETDEKGENEKTGDVGSNHMHHCGEKDGGSRMRVE